MAAPSPPRLPADDLGDGWELTSDETETLFELSGMEVIGRTAVYEDCALEATVREACGVGDLSRFVFATRLDFSPPLPAGGHALVRPTVVSEARTEFATTLEDRGFRSVERQRRQRMRTGSGTRATLVGYQATVPADDVDLPVEGWLSVWYDDDFLLAGGAYPRHFDGLDVPVDTSGFRDDLLAVIREVE